MKKFEQLFNDEVINEVVTLKLNSGEELICKVVKVTDDFIETTSPVSVAPGPQGLGLVPSMYTVGQSEIVMINISNVTMFAKTEESVKFKYVEATTGIKIPTKKMIIG